MSKSLSIGAIFGFSAPLLGMFVGLQVSPLLANILMLPIVPVSYFLGKPIGMLSL